MKITGLVTLLATALALVGAPRGAPAQEVLHADLQGIEETPAISTVASGEFRARISRDEQFIDFELSYAGLEAAPLFAHIHFGQAGVAGQGIAAGELAELAAYANVHSAKFPGGEIRGQIKGSSRP